MSLLSPSLQNILSSLRNHLRTLVRSYVSSAQNCSTDPCVGQNKSQSSYSVSEAPGFVPSPYPISLTSYCSLTLISTLAFSLFLIYNTHVLVSRPFCIYCSFCLECSSSRKNSSSFSSVFICHLINESHTDRAV